MRNSLYNGIDAQLECRGLHLKKSGFEPRHSRHLFSIIINDLRGPAFVVCDFPHRFPTTSALFGREKHVLNRKSDILRTCGAIASVPSRHQDRISGVSSNGRLTRPMQDDTQLLKIRHFTISLGAGQIFPR
jgi:hypothetical protein